MEPLVMSESSGQNHRKYRLQRRATDGLWRVQTRWLWFWWTQKCFRRREDARDYVIGVQSEKYAETGSWSTWRADPVADCAVDPVEGTQRSPPTRDDDRGPRPPR